MHELMGKIVLVHRVFKRIYSPLAGGNQCWNVVLASGRPGWVVGERWLQDGSVQCNYGHDGNVWVPRKGTAQHCLLVAYWPTLRPVNVPDDGYELASEMVRPYVTPQPWCEDWREMQRKEMADWPRDTKGRWVKQEVR